MIGSEESSHPTEAQIARVYCGDFSQAHQDDECAIYVEATPEPLAFSESLRWHRSVS